MTKENQPKQPSRGIESIEICGFKSISDKISVIIRPLTVVAGANSSGKSSAMQILLILKQTLESSYDPGAIQINGNNIQFTDLKQIFNSSTLRDMKIDVKISFDGGKFINAKYAVNVKNREIIIDSFSYGQSSKNITTLKDGGVESDSEEIEEYNNLIKSFKSKNEKTSIQYVRERCFLVPFAFFERGSEKNRVVTKMSLPAQPISRARDLITSTIHLPGLRGNPERIYPLTVTEERFPGRFENYVAGIIWRWQEKNSKEFKELKTQLKYIGLTGDLKVKRVSDAGIEIYVGKNRDNTGGLVSIADVGLGVSQILPILVALIQAKRGQTVFVEQPEIHLHPMAQSKLTMIFATAMKRGVRIVVETHSSNLLLAIQTSVARGEMPYQDIVLHWFTKGEQGKTCLTTANLERDGSFGDWPADFDDTLLDQQDAYLDAIEKINLESK